MKQIKEKIGRETRREATDHLFCTQLHKQTQLVYSLNQPSPDMEASSPKLSLSQNNFMVPISKTPDLDSWSSRVDPPPTSNEDNPSHQIPMKRKPRASHEDLFNQSVGTMGTGGSSVTDMHPLLIEPENGSKLSKLMALITDGSSEASKVWSAAAGLFMALSLIMVMFFVKFSTDPPVAVELLDIETMPAVHVWPPRTEFIGMSTDMKEEGKPMRLRLNEIARTVISNNHFVMESVGEECMYPSKYTAPWNLLTLRSSGFSYINTVFIPDETQGTYTVKLKSGDQTRVAEFFKRFSIQYEAAYTRDGEPALPAGGIVFGPEDDKSVRACIQNFYK